MNDRVEIHTIHTPNGIQGEVIVDGLLILTIRNGALINHIGAEPLFTSDVIQKMDHLIKEWIKEHLKK
jgi:hypothetical protein